MTHLLKKKTTTLLGNSELLQKLSKMNDQKAIEEIFSKKISKLPIDEFEKRTFRLNRIIEVIK